MCPICVDDVYAPVCGSDGSSYANECRMKRASCTLNQEIVVVKRKSCGVQGVFDVLYAIDGSQRITPNFFAQIKKFILSSARSYNLSGSGARIGLIVYGDKVKNYLDFNAGITYNSFIKAVAASRRVGGSIDLSNVVDFVDNEFFADNILRNDDDERIMVLVLSGKGDENGAAQLRNKISLLKQQGVRVIVVGFKGVTDPQELIDLASTSADIIMIDGIINLPDGIGPVEKQIGNRVGK